MCMRASIYEKAALKALRVVVYHNLVRADMEEDGAVEACSMPSVGSTCQPMLGLWWPSGSVSLTPAAAAGAAVAVPYRVHLCLTPTGKWEGVP